MAIYRPLWLVVAVAGPVAVGCGGLNEGGAAAGVGGAKPHGGNVGASGGNLGVGGAVGASGRNLGVGGAVDASGGNDQGCAGSTCTEPGDAGVPLPTCSTQATAPIITSCVQPMGGWASDDGTGRRSAKFGGTIISVTPGPIADGCLAQSGVADSDIVSLIVQDGTGPTAWIVQYAAPASKVAWVSGKHIDVEYSTAGGGWGPVVSSLFLNYGQAVDVYIGTGASLANIYDVPLLFREGPAICLQHAECGELGLFDLEVNTNAGWARVPFGESVQVSGYRVIHGGYVAAVWSTVRCVDWYPEHVLVAVLREI